MLKDDDEKSQESSPERTTRRALMMRRQATESDLNGIFESMAGKQEQRLNNYGLELSPLFLAAYYRRPCS